MPIEVPEPPEAAVATARRAIVGRLRQEPLARRALLRQVEARSMTLSMPHRAAHLGLVQVARGKTLRSVARIGNWRFLVRGSEPRARDGAAVEAGATPGLATVAAIAVTESGANFSPGELNFGPFASGMDAAIRRAEDIEKVRTGRYEPILLNVPALYVVALWLFDLGGEDDLLLVLPQSNPAFAPLSPITAPAFMGRLVALAAKVR